MKTKEIRCSFFNNNEYKLDNVMELPDQYKSLIKDILKKP